MGSIPLVAESIRPQPDALESIGRLQAIKSMLGQQQLQQQQIQGAGLENQQRQIALQDQQATTAAMHDWDGKDINELPSLILKHGGSSTAVFGAKNQITTLTKNAADADSAVLKNQADRNDMIAGHLENVKSASPEKKQDAYAAAVGDLVQKGYAKPGQLPDQYPGDDKIDAFEKTFMGQKQIIQQELDTRAKNSEAQKNAAQAGEANAAAAKSTSEALWYQQHPQAGAPGVPAEAMSASDWLAKNPGKTFSDYTIAMKKIVPAYNFNLQNGVPGAGPSAPLSDKVIDALAAPNSQLKLSDVLPPRAPQSVRQAALNQVLSKYPNYSSGDYALEQDVKKKFTSGNVSDQLMAINTAREHMKTFSSLADALDNGDIQELNKIGNEIGVQFGSDKATNQRIAAQAFGGEVGKAFDGAGVVAGEREEAQKNMADYLSKGQFKGAIKTVDELLAGKQKSAQDSYNKGVQAKPNFGGGANPNADPTDPFAQFGGKRH